MVSSTIRQVVSLIEDDLQRRGLAVGDAYLTAEEVGQEFSVHPRSASRAMRLLAKRGVLTRKRGAGTFIGPNVRPPSSVRIRCVHVLTTVDRKRTGMPMGELLEGILESTGSNNVQLNMLPLVDQVSHVQELLERGRDDDTLSGCVLIGCVREIQEAVLGSGVPAVVFGGVYPSTSELASVDTDQAELGYLLAKHMIERNRRNLALIARELWLPGDDLHHDGIRRALAEMQCNHGGIMIRTVPPVGIDSMTEVVVQVLSQKDRPTALLCRDPVLATAAMKAAAALGLRVPDDIDIGVNHWFAESELDLPHTCATLTYREQAGLVGTMLRDIISGKRPEPDHVVIPGQLIS